MLFPKIIKSLLVAGLFAIACGGVWIFLALRPVGGTGESRAFEVSQGSGFREIAFNLRSQGLIRSKAAFEMYAVLSGLARTLQPGRYKVSPGDSGVRISAILAAGPEQEVTVTIPEGMTSVDIDRIVSEAGVTVPGEFFRLASSQGLEGRLFPDTYRFYFNSTAQTVVDKLLANFERRAASLLVADPGNASRALILASILEKEVQTREDMEIVAGLLLNRVKAGMPLQVDAGLCYAKEQLNPDLPCEPLTKLDKEIDSPYNTYLHSGWPPGAISNPGVLAIEAALHPKDSPYWYYLSDPKTGKTIFARTIEEQVMNQLKYLKNN